MSIPATAKTVEAEVSLRRRRSDHRRHPGGGAADRGERAIAGGRPPELSLEPEGKGDRDAEGDPGQQVQVGVEHGVLIAG
jgi:hypothetical protein